MVKNIRKDVEKREPLYPLHGSVIDAATVENTMEFPQKLKK